MDTLDIPLNNHSLADLKRQWLAPNIAGVKFTAIRRKRAPIVHRHGIAAFRFAATFDRVEYFDGGPFGCSGCDGVSEV